MTPLPTSNPKSKMPPIMLDLNRDLSDQEILQTFGSDALNRAKEFRNKFFSPPPSSPTGRTSTDDEDSETTAVEIAFPSPKASEKPSATLPPTPPPPPPPESPSKHIATDSSAKRSLRASEELVLSPPLIRPVVKTTLKEPAPVTSAPKPAILRPAAIPHGENGTLPTDGEDKERFESIKDATFIFLFRLLDKHLPSLEVTDTCELFSICFAKELYRLEKSENCPMLPIPEKLQEMMWELVNKYFKKEGIRIPGPHL